MNRTISSDVHVPEFVTDAFLAVSNSVVLSSARYEKYDMISASRVSLCASYKTDLRKVRILSYLSCPWKIVSRVATFICYMALLIQTLRARIYYEND